MRVTVIIIIIKVISISSTIASSDGGSTVTIPVKMNRVKGIFILVGVPGRMINFVSPRGWRVICMVVRRTDSSGAANSLGRLVS